MFAAAGTGFARARAVAEISDNVRELIRRRATSMDHIEILMRLYEAGGEPLTVTDVERGARLGPETVARSLSELVSSGLIARDAASNTYRYAAPASDRATVDELSALYHQRPVTLVKLVYAQPPSPVKSFADAFRLRDDEDPSRGGGTS
jgi:DNA-binding Lrp family transcriptional regulator